MDMSEIAGMLDGLLNDTTIPKNIRRALGKGKARLEGAEEKNVKLSAAIYLIEGVSEDINMPSHARTQIWALMSSLESLI